MSETEFCNWLSGFLAAAEVMQPKTLNDVITPIKEQLLKVKKSTPPVGVYPRAERPSFTWSSTTETT